MMQVVFPNKGSMIWNRRKDRSQNRYLVFCKTFSLPEEPPVGATLSISAYACYQVAVNGIPVGRGPDPSNHNRYYVDSYAVAPHLRKGRNVISVLAYAFGPRLPKPECAYLAEECGWLCFELQVQSGNGNTQWVVSDATCRVRPADAWRQKAPGYTELRAAYKEYYDAARFGVAGWLETRDAKGPEWKSAVALASGDLRYRYSFHAKEIPPFRYREVMPTAAFAIDGGFAYGLSRARGWQIENHELLVPGYPQEGYDTCFRKGEPNFPRSRVETDARDACLVHAVPGSGTASILLDFGGMRYGCFEIELETEAAGSEIDIGYGESLNITFVDRYRTRDGRQTFAPYHFRAGRYVMLSFRKLTAPIRLRAVRFRECDHSVDDAAEAFVAAHEGLQRIHAASVNTLRLNMHSHFEDCPWREQKLYLGDLLLEALSTYYLWGDYAYVRKNLMQLADRNRPDGWISNGPGCSHGSLDSSGMIVDFPVYFVFELRDYYLFSGDHATLALLYPKAMGVMEKYLDMGIRRHGLVDIGAADSFANWCVINWNDVVKQGRCAALNFQVARGMAAAAQMARWLGRDTEADAWQARYAAMRRATHAAFWDASRGLYRDAHYRGRPVQHFSTETNTLALLSGLPDKAQTARILEALTQGRLTPDTPTAFFNAQVAEALFLHRQTEAALALIERYWGAMLRRGTDAFWEIFLPETPPAAFPPKAISLCHGWSCGPAYLFSAYLLGVRPLEPGFRTFCVDPQPGDLTSLAGRIPTPQGPISLRLTDGKLTLSHPPGTCPVSC